MFSNQINDETESPKYADVSCYQLKQIFPSWTEGSKPCKKFKCIEGREQMLEREY